MGKLRIICSPKWKVNIYTVYDRIDAAARINFSTQFGAATIRERRLFESGVYFVRRWYGLKKSSEEVNDHAQSYKHTDSVLVLLPGVRVNVDGFEVASSA